MPEEEKKSTLEELERELDLIVVRYFTATQYEEKLKHELRQAEATKWILHDQFLEAKKKVIMAKRNFTEEELKANDVGWKAMFTYAK